MYIYFYIILLAKGPLAGPGPVYAKLRPCLQMYCMSERDRTRLNNNWNWFNCLSRSRDCVPRCEHTLSLSLTWAAHNLMTTQVWKVTRHCRQLLMERGGGITKRTSERAALSLSVWVWVCVCALAANFQSELIYSTLCWPNKNTHTHTYILASTLAHIQI